MAYSEKVIDHYQNPKNVGTLDKSKKNVGTGLVGAPECGDVMRLQIEVDDTTGMITDAKFKTFGCDYRGRIESSSGENPLFSIGRRCYQSSYQRLSYQERNGSYPVR